jgi:hypothetical protein
MSTSSDLLISRRPLLPPLTAHQSARLLRSASGRRARGASEACRDEQRAQSRASPHYRYARDPSVCIVMSSLVRRTNTERLVDRAHRARFRQTSDSLASEPRDAWWWSQAATRSAAARATARAGKAGAAVLLAAQSASWRRDAGRPALECAGSSSVGGVRHRAPCSRETRYSGLIGHDAGRPTTAPVALLASCECVGDVGSGTCSVACAVLRDGASLRSGVGARATRERRQVTAPRLRRRRVMLAAAFSEEVVQCPRNPSYRLRSTTGQRTR